MKINISVCGSDGQDTELQGYALEVAEKVGACIARKGGVLVCGGRGGVMEAACRGVRQENGIAVGIMPQTRQEANEFVDIAIPTGIGHKRNFLVVSASRVIIAIGGRWGTLNEISFAMIFRKPVILIRGTGGCVDRIINKEIMQDIESTYYIVDTAEEAVEKAFELSLDL